MRAISLALALSLTFMCCSCKHANGSAPVVSSQAGSTLLQAGVSEGLSFGLGAMKDQAAAQAAANQITLIVTNTIIPYLNGGANVPSNVLDTIMKEQLLTSLPPEVQALISSAASIANVYLPVPSSTTYLNADELNYVKALANGLANGASMYLAGHPATKAPRGMNRESRWLNYKRQ